MLEHVLPDRVARAGVVEADPLLVALRAQRPQPRDVVVGEHLLRPARGERGAVGELVQRDRAGDGQVVVAGEADGGVLAHQRAAVVGVGAVADDVAQAPQLAGAGGRDVGEHRLEGVPVAVDVGDDGDEHGNARVRPMIRRPPVRADRRSVG